MKKDKKPEYEARMAEILKDKEKIAEAVRDAPFFRRKYDEAVEQRNKLKLPLSQDGNCF